VCVCVCVLCACVLKFVTGNYLVTPGYTWL